MRLLDRLRTQEDGVAAVEFALIVPFLILLYLGSMEASVLFTADKRVNTISATLGDLVSQWDPDSNPAKLPATTLTNYFGAATNIMSPYTTSSLKQVVSLVFVKNDGTTKVIWSIANGTGATARPEGQPFTALGSTSGTNEVARGGCIVAAETNYTYKPMFGQAITSNINLYHINYFIPRFGATDPIIPDSKTISATACTTGS